jgi:uncharacterized membrane protein YraQ (UPF0718 family)
MSQYNKPQSEHDSHNCCENDTLPVSQQKEHCQQASSKIDWLLYISLFAVAVLYMISLFLSEHIVQLEWLKTLSNSVYVLMNSMWWGLAMGILMLSILGRIPREFVMSILGTNSGLVGIMRATGAGVLLDLCSHGILMVGSKLYERGASIGQVIAFLIASPWNSFSLTFILFSLIGFNWTLLFIIFSMLIAVITGLSFDLLVKRGHLPDNPAKQKISKDFHFWPEVLRGLARIPLQSSYFRDTLVQGIKDARMVMRWILFGVLMASFIRLVMSPEHFGAYFGPTILGLGLTIFFATIIEICSEGSTPIAADILTRARAPGNSFAFLMAGVATDYTELMVIKDMSRSWRIALFLPLLTVPQVVFVAWLMNWQ